MEKKITFSLQYNYIDTFIRESKLATDHSSLKIIPEVITYCTILIVVTHQYSALSKTSLSHSVVKPARHCSLGTNNTVVVIQSLKLFHCNSLQFIPLPVYPTLHKLSNQPIVFIHPACSSHVCIPNWHSSISAWTSFMIEHGSCSSITSRVLPVHTEPLPVNPLLHWQLKLLTLYCTA